MYYATNSRDSRLNYKTENFADFAKMAFLGIKSFGHEEWSFEGNGVELDPVHDLGVPGEYVSEDFVCHADRRAERTAMAQRRGF